MSLNYTADVQSQSCKATTGSVNVSNETEGFQVHSYKMTQLNNSNLLKVKYRL